IGNQNRFELMNSWSYAIYIEVTDFNKDIIQEYHDECLTLSNDDIFEKFIELYNFINSDEKITIEILLQPEFQQNAISKMKKNEDLNKVILNGYNGILEN